jgi:antitoxin ParD1/3/4
MATTDATEQFTVTLSTDVLEFVRSKVSAGEYATESDFIEAAIVQSIFPAPSTDADLVHWMNTEGARRCAALDANPSSGLTLEEAFAGLEDEDFDEFAKAS